MPDQFGRRTASALRALLAASTAAAVVAPASALAASSPGRGGAGLGSGGSSSGGTPGQGGAGSGTSSGATAAPVIARAADTPVSASGDGITLHSTSTALLRDGLTFQGSAAGDAGRTVVVERSGRETGWRWTPTVQTTVAPDGGFAATWRTDHIGRFAVRAIALPAGTAAQVRTEVISAGTRAPSTSSLTVTVYLPTKATLYGPGFYGRRTACGQRLTRATIGVANRSLRCGEKVALLYGGHTLVVPVIDRGPYANGASWDLTVATGRALGMTGTEQLGAVSLPHPPVY